jgi:hypothetical protein
MQSLPPSPELVAASRALRCLQTLHTTTSRAFHRLQSLLIPSRWILRAKLFILLTQELDGKQELDNWWEIGGWREEDGWNELDRPYLASSHAITALFVTNA